MNPLLSKQFAALYIDELQRQAARQRLNRELRARRATATRQRRGVWNRLLFRQPRPAME